MNELTTIFSQGMSQMLTFTLGASAGVVGLALAIKAIEYAKDLISLSGDERIGLGLGDHHGYFDYVFELEGVEIESHEDGSYLLYDGLAFDDASDLNNYLVHRNSEYDSSGDYAYDDGEDWDPEPLRQSLNK